MSHYIRCIAESLLFCSRPRSKSNSSSDGFLSQRIAAYSDKWPELLNSDLLANPVSPAVGQIVESSPICRLIQLQTSKKLGKIQDEGRQFRATLLNERGAVKDDEEACNLCKNPLRRVSRECIVLEGQKRCANCKYQGNEGTCSSLRRQINQRSALR